jgi:hypothetical protein
MKKTYTFSNANGTFVCFLDYEDEGDFKDFLSFVCGKLDLDVPLISETPHSLVAEFEYGETSLSASYITDAGCHLHIPSDTEWLAGAIVEKCYGQTA